MAEENEGSRLAGTCWRVGRAQRSEETREPRAALPRHKVVTIFRLRRDPRLPRNASILCASTGCIAVAVGIFDQMYSCLTHVVHEVLTLYTHPPTVRLSSVEFITTYPRLSGIIERRQVSSNSSGKPPDERLLVLFDSVPPPSFHSIQWSCLHIHIEVSIRSCRFLSLANCITTTQLITKSHTPGLSKYRFTTHGSVSQLIQAPTISADFDPVPSD